MHAVLLAAVQPDNTPHGYNLTFAFPELMFIIIAGALYLRFRRPHRVPGRADLAAAASAAPAAPTVAAASAAPEAYTPEIGMAADDAGDGEAEPEAYTPEIGAAADDAGDE